MDLTGKNHPLLAFLAEHPATTLLLCKFLSLTSIPSGRLVPIHRAKAFASTGGNAGLVAHHGVATWVLASGSGAFHLGRSGEETWVPDWSTLQASPFQPNQAEVFCSVHEHDVGFDMCPRARAQDYIDAFQKQYAQDVLIGWEIEFCLLESITSLKPSEDLAALDAPNDRRALRHPKAGAVLREAIEVLEKHDIPVWHASSEGGTAQLEIATAPQPAAVAGDKVLDAIAIIKEVAEKHGVYATMAPVPFEGGPVAGLHMHMSLSKPEAVQEHFLGGLLGHLNEMSAIAQPQVQSYERPTFASGWSCWADRLVTGAIRRVRDGQWEFRVPDATANPYLLIVAALALGAHGIDGKIPVTIKARARGGPIGPEEREELNITQPLSGNLSDALEAMKASEIIKGALGETLFERYLAVKEAEVQHVAGLSVEVLREQAARLW